VFASIPGARHSSLCLTKGSHLDFPAASRKAGPGFSLQIENRIGQGAAQIGHVNPDPLAGRISKNWLYFHPYSGETRHPRQKPDNNLFAG
jgi:hypothetical protein